MSKYRRIKYEDRCQIYALSKRGSSQESIAEVLGVSQSAVSRRFTAIVVSAAIGSSKRKPRLRHGRRYEVSPASSRCRRAVRSRRSCARCAGRRSRSAAG